jgi:hypothetical protein
MRRRSCGCTSSGVCRRCRMRGGSRLMRTRCGAARNRRRRHHDLVYCCTAPLRSHPRGNACSFMPSDLVLPACQWCTRAHYWETNVLVRVWRVGSRLTAAIRILRRARLVTRAQLQSASAQAAHRRPGPSLLHYRHHPPRARGCSTRPPPARALGARLPPPQRFWPRMSSWVRGARLQRESAPCGRC